MTQAPNEARRGLAPTGLVSPCTFVTPRILSYPHGVKSVGYYVGHCGRGVSNPQGVVLAPHRIPSPERLPVSPRPRTGRESGWFGGWRAAPHQYDSHGPIGSRVLLTTSERRAGVEPAISALARVATCHSSIGASVSSTSSGQRRFPASGRFYYRSTGTPSCSFHHARATLDTKEATCPANPNHPEGRSPTSSNSKALGVRPCPKHSPRSGPKRVGQSPTAPKSRQKHKSPRARIGGTIPPKNGLRARQSEAIFSRPRCAARAHHSLSVCGQGTKGDPKLKRGCDVRQHHISEPHHNSRNREPDGQFGEGIPAAHGQQCGGPVARGLHRKHAAKGKKRPGNAV